MPESDFKRLEFLAGHYRESFSLQRDYIGRRDRAFGYALLAGVALALRVSDLAASDHVFGVLLQRVSGQELRLDAGVLAVLMWFVQFALVVRYFQATMTVERQYNYIHRVEGEMCSLFGSDLLAREGASYFLDYPKFSDWVHAVYTMVFPAAFVILVCWSLALEFSVRGARSPVPWIAALLAMATLITIGLFWWSTRSAGQPKGGHGVDAPGAGSSPAADVLGAGLE